MVNNSGGHAACAADAEIIDALKLLATTEGIFTEPAGGTTLACAIKLIELGHISRDESICICITGNGLKTVDVLAEVGNFPDAPVIDAKLTQFDDLMSQIDETTTCQSKVSASSQAASNIAQVKCR